MLGKITTNSNKPTKQRYSSNVYLEAGEKLGSAIIEIATLLSFDRRVLSFLRGVIQVLVRESERFDSIIEE